MAFLFIILAVTLTGKDAQVEWDVLSSDDDYPRGQKLIIKQILLGAEAKDDEFNVVEVNRKSIFYCVCHRLEFIKMRYVCLIVWYFSASFPVYLPHQKTVVISLIQGQSFVFNCTFPYTIKGNSCETEL